MLDKFGRFVKVDEVKGRRVFKVSGSRIVFIANKELPIYLMIEAIEKTYGAEKHG